MGREMRGRFRREGLYVYLWLIHVEIWLKTTKSCKAIILQLKRKISLTSDLSTWLDAWLSSEEGFIICRAQGERKGGTPQKIIKNFKTLGLLWWLRGKESTCQFKRHGFSSQLEKILHASEQLNPWATNYWARALEPGNPNFRSLCSSKREVTGMRSLSTK